jgi:hypothetical protein
MILAASCMQSMYLTDLHHCIKPQQPALDEKLQVLGTPSCFRPSKSSLILRRIVDISDKPHPLPLCLFDEPTAVGSQQVAQAKARLTVTLLDEPTLQSRTDLRVPCSQLSIPTSPLGYMASSYQEPAGHRASNYRAAAIHCHTDLQPMLHNLQVHARELTKAGWSHRSIL